MHPTNTTDNPRTGLLLGAASGLAAGLAGAVAMTAFQAVLARGRITSGVSGPPSTEKAADRLALATVRHGVPRSRRPAAGETLHNVVATSARRAGRWRGRAGRPPSPWTAAPTRRT